MLLLCVSVQDCCGWICRHSWSRHRRRTEAEVGGRRGAQELRYVGGQVHVAHQSRRHLSSPPISYHLQRKELVSRLGGGAVVALATAVKTPGNPSWLPCRRSEHRSERPGSMSCHCSELRVHAPATFASLLRQESPVGDQRRACFCSHARSLAGQPLATPASAATRQSPGRARADPPSSAAQRSRPLGPVF